MWLREHTSQNRLRLATLTSSLMRCCCAMAIYAAATQGKPGNALSSKCWYRAALTLCDTFHNVK